MFVRFATGSFLALACVSGAFAETTPAATQAPALVVAEPVQPAPAPALVAKLTLPSADGSQKREYEVSDFSFSLARSFSYAGAEGSANFSITKGIDEHLLTWASQASTDAAQFRNVTVRSDDPNAPKVFELEGARVIGFSLAGGSINLLSLQISVRSVTVDGVRMN